MRTTPSTRDRFRRTHRRLWTSSSSTSSSSSMRASASITSTSSMTSAAPESTTRWWGSVCNSRCDVQRSDTGDMYIMKLDLNRKTFVRPPRGWVARTLPLVCGLALTAMANAADTIKVGVLHSLSGTMAISETTLKDTVLMLIDEQNRKGGLLGKKLEAVVVDPASNWPLFAVKASELLEKVLVAVVFGCWTSVSRKSVLPVFEKDFGLLFYPVQYEGEESSKNVIYTGAAPNQQALAAVDYLTKEVGVKRWALAGTDYVYPRTTNKILEAYLKAKGVKSEDIMINYTPFGHSDWQSIVAVIKIFGSQGKKTAVVSTINGDANVPFYKELGNQSVSSADIPVIAFSVGEEELSGFVFL